MVDQQNYRYLFSSRKFFSTKANKFMQRQKKQKKNANILLKYILVKTKKKHHKFRCHVEPIFTSLTPLAQRPKLNQHANEETENKKKDNTQTA